MARLASLLGCLGLVLAAASTAADLACPEGTVAAGAAPPRGQKQWCQRPDGTQHGPSVSWSAPSAISGHGAPTDSV